MTSTQSLVVAEDFSYLLPSQDLDFFFLICRGGKSAKYVMLLLAIH